MATGYTYFIEEGKINNAKDFLMLCARNCGACISMKDEPLDKPIPEHFVPNDFYAKQLEHSKHELERYQKMSLEDAIEECEKEYKEERERRDKQIEQDKILLNKYKKILEEIREWNPPTPQHQGLKSFAIEQIEMSLPDVGFSDRMFPLEKMNPDKFIEHQISRYEEDIKHFEERVREENERYEGRNEWIQQLRDSLK